MPRIRFSSLPRPLWEHLLARVAERQISLNDLIRLQDWVKTAPEAPEGDWYKDFGMARSSVVRGRPPGSGGGKSGASSVQAASVRSVG